MIGLSQGQTSRSQTIFSPKVSKIGFHQDLNAYDWFYDLNYLTYFTGKIGLGVEENFRSSLLRVGELGDKWKDDQKLGVRLLYQGESRFSGSRLDPAPFSPCSFRW